MKRLPHTAILLAVVAFVAADKGEKKKKGDAEKIQGKWTVVEWHRKGKVRYDQVGDVLTFSGKKIVFGDNEKEEAVFNLRPDKKPRELDMSLSDGDQIEIEERSPSEVTEFRGVPVAPEGVEAFNPGFDITPARYVSAIITEAGVARPPYLESLELAVKSA